MCFLSFPNFSLIFRWCLIEMGWKCRYIHEYSIVTDFVSSNVNIMLLRYVRFSLFFVIQFCFCFSMYFRDALFYFLRWFFNFFFVLSLMVSCNVSSSLKYKKCYSFLFMFFSCFISVVGWHFRRHCYCCTHFSL